MTIDVQNLISQVRSGKVSLSDEALQYLESVKRETNSLNRVDQLLRKSIREATQAGARNIRSTKATVLKGGRVINATVTDAYRFTVSFKTRTTALLPT